MAANVIWSRPAQRHLREIRHFIAEDSERYTQMTIERIRSAVRRLEEFPESGRLVPELSGSRYREVLVGRYRALYRYDEDKGDVFVLAVVHGSRRLPPIIDGAT